MMGWDTKIYETADLAKEDSENTENGLSDIGSTEIGLSEVGSTDIGSTEVGKSATTYSGIKKELIETNLDGISPSLSPQGEHVRVTGTESISHLEAGYKPYSPGFLLVCAAHPKQPIEGKKQAWGIWEARQLEARAAEIAEKLARLVVTKWKDRTYYPLLKTWLTNADYDDELVPLDVTQDGDGGRHPVPTHIADKRTFIADEKSKFVGDADAGPPGSQAVLDGDGTVIDGVEYYRHS